MTFDDMLALAQTAAKIASVAGLLPGASALIAAAAEIAAIVKRNVDVSRAALDAESLAELDAILGPLHARILSLGNELDAAATAASQR